MVFKEESKERNVKTVICKQKGKQQSLTITSLSATAPPSTLPVWYSKLIKWDAIH